MYFQDLFSNNAMIAIAKATQPSPVNKPAMVPKIKSPLPINIAKLVAIMKEKTIDSANTLGIFLLAKSVSVKPLADIQVFLKIEYQMPPIKKVEIAAKMIANQFRFLITSEKFTLFNYSLYYKFRINILLHQRITNFT